MKILFYILCFFIVEISANESCAKGAAKVSSAGKTIEKGIKKVGNEIKNGINKIAGGAEAEIKKLVSAIEKTPKELEKFNKGMRDMAKKMRNMQKMLRSHSIKIQEMQHMHDDFEVLIDKKEEEVDKISSNQIFLNLHIANKLCGTPPMEHAVSIPYVGNAINALCVHIATIDLKFHVILDSAGDLMRNASTVSDKLSKRITSMKSEVSE